LAATLKRIGQIARSAGTSHFDNPFTVTKRSNVFAVSTARATKKPERAKPRATKIPKIKAAVGRDRESFIGGNRF
jgi:hypothetical protein